jgi:Transglycosylase SLT domain
MARSAIKKIGPLSVPVPEDDTGGDATVDMGDDGDMGDDSGDGGATVSGPLSLSDPRQYNANMQMLLGQLIDTPEQQRKNEILAWSAGGTDPSGQGNLFAELGNSQKAQLAYRLKDKELRAMYIPTIMQALGANQKAGGVDLSNIDFRKMPEEEVARLSVLAKRDLLPYWKQANFGEKQEAGTYTMRRAPDGTVIKEWNLDPKSGLTVNADNSVGVAPGAPQSQATIAGAVTDATEQAKAGWTQVTVVGPDNTKYTLYQSQANPQLFGRDAKGTGAATLPANMKITPVAGPAGSGGTPPGGGGAGGTTQNVGGPRSWDEAVALVESNNKPTAVSPKGARSTMGVMPATADMPGYGVKPSNGTLEDDARMGRDYRAALQKKFGEQSGLAAYNMGPKAFDDWQKAGGQWSKLPAETRDYIGKVNLAREGHGIYGGNAGRAAEASPQGAAAPVATSPAAVARPGVPAGAIQTGENPVTAQKQAEVGMANKTVLEKDIPAIQKAADQAGVMRDQIKQQRDAIANGAATGRWADVITSAAQFGAAFGWEDADKIATESGKFNNAVRKQVFANLALQNGVQTEGDANRMREALTQLKDSPKLTGFLLAAADATAKRDQDKAAFFNTMAQKIRDGEIQGNYADIDQAWRKRMKPLHEMPEMQDYMEFIRPKEKK